MDIQLVSSGVAIVSIIFLAYQIRLQTKLLKFNALSEIHKDVFTKEFREALRIIFKADKKELEYCQSKKLTDSIMLVASLYDLLGVRVQEKAVPKKPTLKTEWKILILLWDRIGKFIYREREARKLPYKEHLEWLVNEAKKYKKKYYPDSVPTVSPVIYNYVANTSDSPNMRLIYKGRHLYFYEGENGWEYVHRPNAAGGVAIVALTDKDEIILVEQYRIPLHKTVIELPAGLVGDEDNNKSEKIEEAVKRELLQETGYDCKKLSCVCRGPGLPGLSDEINSIYLAERLVKKDRQEDPSLENNEDFLDERRKNAAEGEKIDVFKIPLKEVVSWIETQVREGKAVDLRVYAGMFFLKDTRRKLIFPDNC